MLYLLCFFETNVSGNAILHPNSVCTFIDFEFSKTKLADFNEHIDKFEVINLQVFYELSCVDVLYQYVALPCYSRRWIWWIAVWVCVAATYPASGTYLVCSDNMRSCSNKRVRAGCSPEELSPLTRVRRLIPIWWLGSAWTPRSGTPSCCLWSQQSGISKHFPALFHLSVWIFRFPLAC
jgi:hypothetical protein